VFDQIYLIQQAGTSAIQVGQYLNKCGLRNSFMVSVNGSSQVIHNWPLGTKRPKDAIVPNFFGGATPMGCDLLLETGGNVLLEAGGNLELETC
jgi:hypothetical protein